MLVSCVFGFGCVVLSYWRPDDVFSWLLNMIGAVVLVVWTIVAVSHLRLRRSRTFPLLTWVALAGMAAILVLMAREPGTRVQLYATGAMTLALAVAGYARQKALPVANV